MKIGERKIWRVLFLPFGKMYYLLKRFSNCKILIYSCCHFPNVSASVPQFPHCPIPQSLHPLCFLRTSLNSPSSSCHSPLRSSSFPSLLPTFAFSKERNKVSSELFAIMSFQLQFHKFSFFLVLTDTREKYDGTRRSPWNEIECGDHYVRPMAAFLFFELASGQVGY